MLWKMNVELILFVKTLLTNVALEWLLFGMNPHMLGESAFFGKTGRTKLASEWLLTSMSANVSC